MKKVSKKYAAASAKVEAGKLYTVAEAAALVKETSVTKFDASVDISFNLNVNPTLADQLIRGTITLPHGNGKSKKILVVTNTKIDEAKDSGADFYGGKEILEKIVRENWFDFDVIIATPDMMGVVGPLGRILGPRGLMPAPRNGTVTMDVAKVINEYKAGKVEFRNDKGGNVMAIVGKLSFTEEQLAENIQKFIDFVQSLKPATAKGQYVKGTVISATMSPGIRVAQL